MDQSLQTFLANYQTRPQQPPTNSSDLQQLQTHMLHKRLQQLQGQVGTATAATHSTIPTVPVAEPLSSEAASIATSQILQESSEHPSSVSLIRLSSKSSSSAPERVRFNKSQLIQRPQCMSAVSVKDIEVEMCYDENMVRRWYRKTELTSEQCTALERKARSSRLSRAKYLALQTLLEKEHKETAEQNRLRKHVVAKKRVYAQLLGQVVGQPVIELKNCKDTLCPPALPEEDM